MGKMEYPSLTADGVLVTEDDKIANTIVVIHDLSISNNDGAIREFRIRQGSILGDVIFRVGMNATREAHFPFSGILEGKRPETKPVTVTETVTYANAAPDTATRASGSWIDDGFKVGDRFTLVGSNGATNDGTYTISALSATILTIESSENFTTFTAQTEDAVWQVVDKGDLFLDVDATVCTVSAVIERNKTPRG